MENYINRKYNLKMFQLSGLFYFLILLLIGSDRFSFDFSGVTIRYVSFLLLIIWMHQIIFNRILVSKNYLTITISFILASTISLVNSVDIFKSIAYNIWVIFNMIIVGGVFYSLAYRYDISATFRYWIAAYRIQVILLVIELCYRHLSGNLGFWDRPYLWFFEPSYATIYFSGYAGLSYYLYFNLASTVIKPSKVDLILSTLVLFVLSSATGAIVMMVLFSYVLYKKSNIKTLTLVLFVAVGLVVTVAQIPKTNLMFGFITQVYENPTQAVSIIAGRSGNRIIRLLWGIDAFLNYPWTGVGIGADKTYMTEATKPLYTEKYDTPWNNSIGAGFTNPFVEIAGTTGIGGVIALVFTVKIFASAFSTRHSFNINNHIKNAFIFGLLVMMIAFSMEGTFLRYYVWSYVFFTLGLIQKERYRIT